MITQLHLQAIVANARVLALSKKVWDATCEDKRANLPSWFILIQSGD